MANNSSSDAPLSASANVVQDSLVAPAATDAAQATVHTVRDDSALSSSVANNTDPLDLGRHRRENVSKKQIKLDHPEGKNKKQIKKYYTRQNKLIDQFLGADDEEQNKIEEDIRFKPKIKFAVTASFFVNFFLFVIQMYAAIATGSLSLFATAADAFMDLVSSFVMLITSRLAARPSVYKFPVGRTRIETLGIILFCALMTTVAVQLLIESARRLAGGPSESEPLKIIPLVFVGIAIFAKTSLMLYCFAYRRFPSVHIFFVDHRNDIVVNIFGLVMSIVGDRFVWYLDPIGAILIGLLILFSWASNAFEQVWLLVGKSAPRHFISKLIYMAMTHDDRVVKVDTCRAYHAGQRYYVEIDIVMDEDLPLRITHDIAQELQRKLEGLSDVERAFVHVDYEHDHDPHEEHKPLYDKMSTMKPKRSIRDILLFRKPAIQQGLAEAEAEAEQNSS